MNAAKRMTGHDFLVQAVLYYKRQAEDTGALEARRRMAMALRVLEALARARSGWAALRRRRARRNSSRMKVG